VNIQPTGAQPFLFSIFLIAAICSIQVWDFYTSSGCFWVPFSLNFCVSVTVFRFVHILRL